MKEKHRIMIYKSIGLVQFIVNGNGNRNNNSYLYTHRERLRSEVVNYVSAVGREVNNFNLYIYIYVSTMEKSLRFNDKKKATRRRSYPSFFFFKFQNLKTNHFNKKLYIG